MKILWFTNNTVNLKKGLTRGRWMQRLEHNIACEENLQLYIATRYSGKRLIKFTEHKTIYILVPDRRNMLQKRIDITLNREPITELVQRYLDVIKEIKPDIIHVFGTEMEYGMVSNMTDIPVVIHIQGILQPLYYHLTRIKPSFIKALKSQRIMEIIKGNTIQNGLRIFKRGVMIEKNIYEVARYFMGRTAWDQQLAHLLAPDAFYFHCDEMLLPDFLKSTWQGNPAQSLIVVSIISGALYKGHETLIATCRILKEVGLNNFMWKVIGVDAISPAYRFFYKSEMKYLNEHIQLYGELEPDDVIKILKHATVYVHPSHIENSSNSICEAMALGMPVIALYTGGNASLIEQGVDGLLVADNDPATLAAAILRVKAEPAVFREMGQRAQQRARVRHDPERIVQQLKSIYREILTQHGQAA